MQQQQYSDNPYEASNFESVAHAGSSERADFILKTYLHLAAAVAAFVGIEFALLSLPNIDELVMSMIGGRWSWLIVLGAFMLVSHVANRWAQSSTSLGMQYAGLSLYVVAEAIIFVPLLYIASAYGGDDVIPTAALITGIMFGGLTAVVFLTRKDFSFLRGALMLGGFAAMGLIVCGICFGFELGNIFTVFMIVLASGYILYSTSNIMLHYRVGQHVAASLALFASVALLFWYILQLLMSRE